MLTSDHQQGVAQFCGIAADTKLVFKFERRILQSLSVQFGGVSLMADLAVGRCDAHHPASISEVS